MRISALSAAAAVAIAGAAIPAGALGGAHAARGHVVAVRRASFAPRVVVIGRGDNVKWVWHDNTLHNVIGSHFHSPLKAGGSYSVRFTHAGTFRYKCTIHPGMDGKVIVH